MHERFRRGGSGATRDRLETRDAATDTFPLVSSSPAHDENRRSLYHEPQQRRAPSGPASPPHGGGTTRRRSSRSARSALKGTSHPPRRSFRVSRGSHACRPRPRGAPPAAGASRASRSDRASRQFRGARAGSKSRHRRDRDGRSLLGLFRLLLNRRSPWTAFPTPPLHSPASPIPAPHGADGAPRPPARGSPAGPRARWVRRSSAGGGHRADNAARPRSLRASPAAWARR